MIDAEERDLIQRFIYRVEWHRKAGAPLRANDLLKVAYFLDLLLTETQQPRQEN